MSFFLGKCLRGQKGVFYPHPKQDYGEKDTVLSSQQGKLRE